MPYICFVCNIYFSLYPLLNDTDIEDMKRIRASQTITYEINHLHPSTIFY